MLYRFISHILLCKINDLIYWILNNYTQVSVDITKAQVINIDIEEAQSFL